MSDETSKTCDHDWVPMVGAEICYGCNRIRRYDSVTYTATPSTPDPRERGEASEFTALPYWEKAKRLGLPGIIDRALDAACDELFRLRAPAPSEAVAWRDILRIADAIEASDIGQHAQRTGSICHALREAVEQGAKYAAQHPAPARGVTVTEAMRELLGRCYAMLSDEDGPTRVECDRLLRDIRAALTPDAP